MPPLEIRGRLLARNTLFNIAGMAAPVLAGVICLPFIIRGIGVDRFGLLALMWAVVGYMSLLDLGLGRALTQIVAERLGKGQRESIPPLVWTSLLGIFSLGGVGGLLFALLSPMLVRGVLKVPSALQPETLRACYIVAVSIPFVLQITGLRGVLEALQRFELSNAIRIPTGTFSFVGPLVVLPLSHSLVPIVAVLVVGRIVSCFIYLGACIHAMPELKRGVAIVKAELKHVLSFGGWITISNIVGPVMLYADQFFVGSLVSMAAVAYYATPYQIVSKLAVIPLAVAGVLYPAFATCYAGDKNRAASILNRGTKYVFVVIFPIGLILVGFAQEGLALWLGQGFAAQSYRVLQWFAVGLLLSSVAQIPFGFIQGAGRPDITAKLHLLELPLYLGIVWWLIRGMGIEGAALAWVIRVFVDAVALFVIAQRMLPRGAVPLAHRAFFTGVSLLVMALAFLLSGLVAKASFVAAALVAFGTVAWFAILSADERQLLEDRFRAVYSFL